MDDLPDDALGDVLRHLPPRWLAVSRCVRKAWCRTIDERRLLRPDLLPLSFAGIFIQFDSHAFPDFFARPSPSPVNTKLGFLPPPRYPFDEVGEGFDEDYLVRDHCNGLLLTRLYVVKPATRRWDLLPPRRSPADPIRTTFWFKEYLAFDPTMSPHYQVFSIPYLPPSTYIQPDPFMEKSEWPPSTYILDVFSSKSGRWEERSFVREGNVAGIVAEARQDYPCRWSSAKRGAAYWQQALYVHCQPNAVMRISLSDDKYRVIELPTNKATRLYLGRSKKGVYCASFVKDLFRVWILDESYGQMKWMVKGEYDLKCVRASDQRAHGAWVLQDINYEFFRSLLPKVTKKAIVQEKTEWDSDNDGVDNIMDMAEERRHGCDVLGFHPFKEIIFLRSFTKDTWDATVHAYHLNSSRVECLGNMHPACYNLFEGFTCTEQKDEYFSYTPCWVGEFHSNNKCNL